LIILSLLPIVLCEGQKKDEAVRVKRAGFSLLTGTIQVRFAKAFEFAFKAHDVLLFVESSKERIQCISFVVSRQQQLSCWPLRLIIWIGFFFVVI